ncbi:hypothetical protein TgHK011_000043 [Trichoderma gracile]|nr:hypothetical protein TgHK011_000043 [Trichoderma gracile]
MSTKVAYDERTFSRPGSQEENGASWNVPRLSDRSADESYKLFSKVQVADPTPEEARRIRNKLLWRLLPFLCIGYHLMYVDKQTLGSSAILGILEDAKLNADQYNWLSSIFYFGYMVAEWPQNWALQRFPVGKWLAGNLIVWGGITLLHIPCNDFASLFVVRFLLGLSEACIVPAFLLSMSMFFTYQEQAVMMSVMWSIGNSSPITSGFLSYGVLWIKTRSFHPWKWLMGMTLALSSCPLHASFLTSQEQAQAILRIKGNNSGIEQKQFKKRQFVEAIKDPKTWLFALHAWSQEMGNGINNQTSLIINSFGFTVFQTTLLSTVSGVIAFFTLSAAAIALHWTRMLIKRAEFPSVDITGGLCTRRDIQHTAVDPSLVKSLGVAAILPSIIIITLRLHLHRENKRRDKLEAESLVVDSGIIETTNEDGTRVTRVVDNNQLDLTDRENLKFRYVL